MQPEIDYLKIGQRIKQARIEKGLTQSDLGASVGCSNNHMSHIEVGQTKVSLSMLLKLSYALEKNLDYFLLDTPYAKTESVNAEIAKKLEKCTPPTLLSISKMIDLFIEHQNMIDDERQ